MRADAPRELAVYAVAFPLHLDDRERLRQLGGAPLPVIVPDSTPLACTGCGLTLAVGPRTARELTAHPEMRLICPFCLAKLPAGGGTIQHLGNPDSQLEEP